MLPKKILFCTDFSENSETAGKLAVEYAQQLKSTVLILHVIPSWSGFAAYEHGAYAALEEALRMCEESATKDLERISGTFSEALDEIHLFSRVGVPADEIIRLAQEESVDLIVMGTHGLTGIKHLLLGSVAEKVLRTARCPVLVVRSE